MCTSPFEDGLGREAVVRRASGLHASTEWHGQLGGRLFSARLQAACQHQVAWVAGRGRFSGACSGCMSVPQDLRGVLTWTVGTVSFKDGLEREAGVGRVPCLHVSVAWHNGQRVHHVCVCYRGVPALMLACAMPGGCMGAGWILDCGPFPSKDTLGHKKQGVHASPAFMRFTTWAAFWRRCQQGCHRKPIVLWQMCGQLVPIALCRGSSHMRAYWVSARTAGVAMQLEQAASGTMSACFKTAWYSSTSKLTALSGGRYLTHLKSGDTFHTDANGREMLPRRRNHRDTWPLNVTQPIAGNYYPVTAAAYISVSPLYC